MPESDVATRLPENAYRELKPGETYPPMVPPYESIPEVTRRSIVFGIVMNIGFSMAATYLALKVGQGIETAIPISILAVGLSGFLLRTAHGEARSWKTSISSRSAPRRASWPVGLFHDAGYLLAWTG